jgi:DNA invertase Pin-like site-specific DNA recombinase
VSRTAFSYLRYSSTEQSAGDSVRRQVYLRDMMVKKHGWTLDDKLSLLDLGVSAFRQANLREGPLARFLEAVKGGRVPPGSVLIIENIDRFSRANPMDSLPVVCELLNHDVALATVQPERVYERGTDGSSAMLVAMELLVHLTRANSESEAKSSRSKANWQEKRKRAAAGGPHLTRMVPHWLVPKEDGTGFEIDKAKAQVIRLVFRLCADGFGGVKLIRQLNAKNIPSIADGGPRWNVAYVRRIVTSREVLGEFQPCRCEVRVHPKTKRSTRKSVPDGDPIPGYFPAVVTEAEFYAAQAALASRRGRKGRVGERVTNLFTSLVYSAASGYVMFIYTYNTPYGKKRIYLQPSERFSGGDGKGRLVPYEAFERAALHAILELSPDDVSDSGVAEARVGLDKARGQLAALSDRVKRQAKRVADADDGSADYLAEKAVLKELQGRLPPLEAEVKALGQKAAADPQSAVGLVAQLDKTADPDEKANLRTRIRARMPELVESIWVLTRWVDPAVAHTKAPRVHFCQLFTTSGVRRDFAFTTPQSDVALPAELPTEDFRTMCCTKAAPRSARKAAARSKASRAAE